MTVLSDLTRIVSNALADKLYNSINDYKVHVANMETVANPKLNVANYCDHIFQLNQKEYLVRIKKLRDLDTREKKENCIKN